jgi:hypothetical protein
MAENTIILDGFDEALLPNVFLIREPTKDPIKRLGSMVPLYIQWSTGFIHTLQSWGSGNQSEVQLDVCELSVITTAAPGPRRQPRTRSRE